MSSDPIEPTIGEGGRGPGETLGQTHPQGVLSRLSKTALAVLTHDSSLMGGLPNAHGEEHEP